jgi:anti-sigma regulatory factor (Ser/Thr protein kinase)
MESLRRAITPTIQQILKAVEPAGFTEGQREDLEVALAEALANAVVHGNRLRPRTWVGITVKVEPRKCAVIGVKDFGAGFRRESLPDPLEPDKLMLPRGRGVFLMNRLMDGVEYNPKGNRVRMTLRRRSRRRAA